MSEPFDTPLPEATPEADVVGRVLSGKFRVERLLGQGGMGAVYVAQHEYTKRRGALKLLHRRYSAQAGIVERFVREASAAGLIGNPHIVETYDAGMLETGEPYMFMELLDGQPVDDLLEQRGHLPLPEAVAITRQAARALAAAHDADIVHRDVKPANLFMVAGDTPFVKLLDFGVSKFSPLSDDDPMLTSDGDLLGTPMYMSPEQVRGQLDIDGRTDVFSLGVVLYEMLVGKQPFFGGSLMEIGVRICAGEFTPIGQLRPDTPAQLDALLQRVLAVDRIRRPSAREFEAELSGLASGEGALDSGALPAGAADRMRAGLSPADALSETLPSDPSSLRPAAGDALHASAKRPRLGPWLAAALVCLLAAAWLWTRGAAAPREPVSGPGQREPVSAPGQRATPPAAAQPQLHPGPAPSEPRPDHITPVTDEARLAPGHRSGTPAPEASDHAIDKPEKPALPRTETTASKPAAAAATSAPAQRPPTTAAQQDGLTDDNPFD